MESFIKQSGRPVDDTNYEHRHLGKIDVGPHSPGEGGTYNFIYADGTEDQLTLWLEIKMTVTYSPPQSPLTINGLEIDVSDSGAAERTPPDQRWRNRLHHPQQCDLE